MKRIHVSKVTVLLVVVVLLAALSSLFVINRSKTTDAQFNDSLGCNRITLELRRTDKYCGNRDLYRKECEMFIKKKSPDCEPY